MNLFDFLFPPVCPHCGTHVQQQGDWCDACIEEVLHVRQVPSKLLSSLNSAWILADYRGGIKSMIYDVKFNEKKEQSKGAAPFLASYNLRMHDYRPHYVIPIPSSAEKRKVRGYSQVDLFFYDWVLSFSNSNRIDDRKNDDIVNGFTNYDAVEEVYYKWFDCLYKMDTHKEMWALSGSERHRTIDTAFMWNEACDSSLLYDKRILLVDDIFTTGATLESAARILRAYHPQYIEALTLASGSF
ncbi:MAG: phosphoribosyltransferase family protein [Veillonella sp.]|uniref:ComF family protein n=1 Tax=Veillonella sp. TaxID=1926307 RepID=UPI0029146ECA|nr:phosphoribosyltransferase family protein [Veillonella sp.]MDU5732626.1 phosphoribosyltransferase family protein [Veillonella sp.]